MEIFNFFKSKIVRSFFVHLCAASLRKVLGLKYPIRTEDNFVPLIGQDSREHAFHFNDLWSVLELLSFPKIGNF